MKTTNNTEKIYVSFHIGRGGHFHNPGFLTFVGEEDFQDLINRCSDVSMITNDEDEEGYALPDEGWELVDNGGNIILQGRDKIEAKTGCLEWDGIYNTDYVTTTDKLSEKEIEAIWKAYTREEYMSNKLKDTVCTLKGCARVHSIKKYPCNMDVFAQDGCHAFTDINEQAGEFTREEWKENLEEQGFCPLSIEKILDELESYYTEETDFFA